jgi:hypothetical protein
MSKESVVNGVAEFEIVLSVKFADGRKLAYKSPHYLAKLPGIGPELLIHVLRARLGEWVQAVFNE